MLSTEHNVWERFSPLTRWANAATVHLDDYRWAVSQPVADSGTAASMRRTEVLEHGIVPPAYPPGPRTRSDARRALGLPEDARVVLTVANLRVSKDYPNLLSAARTVTTDLPGTVFLSIGQGPLADDMAELRNQLGLGDAFRFLGYREDVRDVMPAADVFCLSSRHEGLPVALMEAYAAGLPVVCTAVGGIPGAVDDGVTGRLVPPGEPAALADALRDILVDDSARAAMHTAALEASLRYDARVAVTRQEATYRAIVAARRGT